MEQIVSPKYKFPSRSSNPVEATIHPARGTSNMRYGSGVWYDIAEKVDDGAVVIVFRDSQQFDLMRKYEWIWIELKEDRSKCGWVSLLIPFENMFKEVT